MNKKKDFLIFKKGIYFVSVVLWKWEKWSDEKLLDELKRIEETGFNTVRVFFDRNDIEVNYKKFNWKNPDRFFNLVKKTNLWILVHPGIKMNLKGLKISDEEFEYIRYYLEEFIKRYKENKRIIAWMLFGEPQPIKKEFISEDEAELFADFLKNEYKNIETLNKAWGLENEPFSLHKPLKNFKECYKLTQKRDWQDYRIRRDLMRFQTDISIENQKKVIEFVKKIDPLRPVRSGGHNLFLNAASNRWDWEKTASICDIFVSSIHIPWHFEQVNGEEDIPLYIQAKMIVDFSGKAIPCAPETTGGSSRYSGNRPFTMTEEKIERFMLYYLASGLKGFGFWLWNPRKTGYECGEYGILDLIGNLTLHGKRAGEIAKLIDRYGKELLELKEKVEVYIFYSWDNEAFLKIISEGQNYFKHLEQELSSCYARIGVSRALINHNIPFKFLTDNQLLTGKVEPRKIIYLPWIEAISENILYHLYDYVKNGGRVVADAPIAYFDEYGRIFNTQKGSIFEKLFGCSIRNFYRIGKREDIIKYKEFEICENEQWIDVETTTGKIIERFDNNYPAIIENKILNGSSILICFSISKMCKNPQSENLQEEIVKIIFKGKGSKVYCKEVLFFSLYGDSIKHCFLINNSSEEKKLKLEIEKDYKKCYDILENKEIDLEKGSIEIFVPKRRGKWLRLSKE